MKIIKINLLALMISLPHYINATETSTSPTLIITGSPIKQSLEGEQKQLEDYDNQPIVDAGDYSLE
ncbi:MAG: hypothetical protein Q9M92_02995 [Enterobacterales bacterium]|nr:hypothetical protein [Enterobacterales bacterium]